MQGWDWMQATPPAPTPAAVAVGALTPEPVEAGGVVVPLLEGKVIEGDFADVDEDGNPLLELYEMVPGTDANGKPCMKPGRIGLIPHDTTHRELEEERGPRWYRILVRGRDGRRLGGGDADMRRPEDHRRRRLGRLGGLGRDDDERGQRPERESWDRIEERINRAVDRARAELEQTHGRVLAAVERERDLWEARAVEAEREKRAAADEVQRLHLQLIEARLSKSGGMDLEQVRAMVEKAREIQEQVNEVFPAAVPDRPDIGASVLSGLRAVRTGVGELVDIAGMVGLKPGGGGGFQLPKVGG